MLDFEHVGLVGKKNTCCHFLNPPISSENHFHVFGEYPKSDLEISAQVASLAARIHLSRELSLAASGFRISIAY